MGQLDGKCIVITGAAQGMGAIHALRCVEEGASVVLTDLQAEAGAKQAAKLGDAAIFVEHDVTSASDWGRVVEAAVKGFGRLDGLVNNAAIWWTETILAENVDKFRTMLEVNVIGSWHGMRAVVPAMQAAGGGSIVNLSSIAGTRGIPDHSSY